MKSIFLFLVLIASIHGETIYQTPEGKIRVVTNDNKILFESDTSSWELHDSSICEVYLDRDTIFINTFHFYSNISKHYMIENPFAFRKINRWVFNVLDYDQLTNEVYFEVNDTSSPGIYKIKLQEDLQPHLFFNYKTEISQFIISGEYACFTNGFELYVIKKSNSEILFHNNKEIAIDVLRFIGNNSILVMKYDESYILKLEKFTKSELKISPHTIDFHSNIIFNNQLVLMNRIYSDSSHYLAYSFEKDSHKIKPQVIQFESAIPKNINMISSYSVDRFGIIHLYVFVPESKMNKYYIYVKYSMLDEKVLSIQKFFEKPDFILYAY